jgi:hypothetical protein
VVQLREGIEQTARLKADLLVPWLYLSLVTILSGFEINNFAGQPGKVSLL